MPRLIFKGMATADVQKISKPLIDELEKLLECPRQYFSLEVCQSDFVFDGKIIQPLAVTEIYWFDRGLEHQDLTAKIVTKYMKQITNGDADVIFHKLERRNYYENGDHF